MAYVINSGAVMQVTLRASMYGQDVMNTLHYRYDGPVIASGLTYLTTFIGVNAQMQALQGLWRAQMSGDVVSCIVIGQWITPLRYRAFNTAQAAATGTLGVGATANVASCLTLVADRASRHGVGNKHLFGLPIDAMDLGALTPGQKALVDTLGVAMVSPIPHTGGVMQPIIFNRALPGDSMEVIGHITNPLVRVQRRRTVGVGQ